MKADMSWRQGKKGMDASVFPAPYFQAAGHELENDHLRKASLWAGKRVIISKSDGDLGGTLFWTEVLRNQRKVNLCWSPEGGEGYRNGTWRRYHQGAGNRQRSRSEGDCRGDGVFLSPSPHATGGLQLEGCRMLYTKESSMSKNGPNMRQRGYTHGYALANCNVFRILQILWL